MSDTTENLPTQGQVFDHSAEFIQACNAAVPRDQTWRFFADTSKAKRTKDSKEIPYLSMYCEFGAPEIPLGTNNPLWSGCPCVVVANGKKANGKWVVVYVANRHRGHDLRSSEPLLSATGSTAIPTTPSVIYPEASTSKLPSAGKSKGKKRKEIPEESAAINIDHLTKKLKKSKRTSVQSDLSSAETDNVNREKSRVSRSKKRKSDAVAAVSNVEESDVSLAPMRTKKGSSRASVIQSNVSDSIALEQSYQPKPIDLQSSSSRSHTPTSTSSDDIEITTGLKSKSKVSSLPTPDAQTVKRVFANKGMVQPLMESPTKVAARAAVRAKNIERALGPSSDGTAHDDAQHKTPFTAVDDAELDDRQLSSLLHAPARPSFVAARSATPDADSTPTSTTSTSVNGVVSAAWEKARTEQDRFAPVMTVKQASSATASTSKPNSVPRDASLTVAARGPLLPGAYLSSMLGRELAQRKAREMPFPNDTRTITVRGRPVTYSVREVEKNRLIWLEADQP